MWLLLIILVLQLLSFAFTAVNAISMGNLHTRLDDYERLKGMPVVPMVRRASTYSSRVSRETGAERL